jgi:hypothetical protein
MPRLANFRLTLAVSIFAVQAWRNQSKSAGVKPGAVDPSDGACNCLVNCRTCEIVAQPS